MKAVGIIILSEDKSKILLSKRSQNEEDEQGKWENVGGKIEGDESFEETIHRELEEELGVTAKNIKEVLVYGTEGEKVFIKVFQVNVEGTPEIKEPEYCDEIKWFEISELKNVDLAVYSKEDFIRLGWLQ